MLTSPGFYMKEANLFDFRFHIHQLFIRTYLVIFLANSFPLTLSQTTNFRLFQTEKLCRRQFQIFITIAESSPNGYKTLWEKEKLLVTSSFSFSHSVFKRLVLQTRKSKGLFGKGLTSPGFYVSAV